MSAHPDRAHSVDSLLHVLYDCVMSPDGFQPFIEKMAEHFQLRAVIMIMRNQHTQEAKNYWITGITQEWMDKYALKYASGDLLSHHIQQSPIANFYASNLDVPHPERFTQHAFYNEWIVPQNIACAAGATVLQEGAWLTQMFLQRTPQQPAFSREDIDQLNQLMPHLQRAIQMRQRFSELRLDRDFMASSLDVLALPILLFDDYGKVAFANRSATLLLDESDSLWLADGHLQTPDKLTSFRIHTEVSKAIRTSRGQQADLNAVVLLQRGERPPLMLLIIPCGGSDRPAALGAAMLFVFDPQRAPDLTQDALARLFSLTPAEASLAEALCAGKTLDEISKQRQISIHTAKSQLKSIFVKTGTRRQPELVSLLLASPAWFLAYGHGSADEARPAATGSGGLP